MKVILVKRASQFSPNMEDKDALILQAVQSLLETEGHSTQLYDEEQLPILPTDIDVILHMARSHEALEWLSQAEGQGIKVLNSAKALLWMNRRALLQASESCAANVAPFAINERGTVPYPCWWKRDDRVSQAKDDVVLLHNDAEWQAVSERGVQEFVIEQHMEGDLVKFYSVPGTDFFNWLHPSFSKFGKEVENGVAQGITFDPQELKRQADSLAQAVGLQIYGGDAIISRDGNMYLIDINDWPSFSPCRQEATRAILEIMNK